MNAIQIIMIVLYGYFFFTVCVVLYKKSYDVKSLAMVFINLLAVVIATIPMTDSITYPAIEGTLQIYMNELNPDEQDYAMQLISNTPEGFMNNLSRIIVLNEMPNKAGLFVLNTNTIYVIYSPYWFQFYLLHELGHNVELAIITAEERDEWISLYDGSQNQTSNYSYVNEKEGFAETFACMYFRSFTPPHECNFIDGQYKYMYGIINKYEGNNEP